MQFCPKDGANLCIVCLQAESSTADEWTNRFDACHRCTNSKREITVLYEEWIF